MVVEDEDEEEDDELDFFFCFVECTSIFAHIERSSSRYVAEVLATTLACGVPRFFRRLSHAVTAMSKTSRDCVS